MGVCGRPSDSNRHTGRAKGRYNQWVRAENRIHDRRGLLAGERSDQQLRIPSHGENRYTDAAPRCYPRRTRRRVSARREDGLRGADAGNEQ